MIVVAALTFAYYFALKPDWTFQTATTSPFYLVLSLVVTFSYYIYFESSEKRATIGKQVLEMQVTDLYGDRISVTDAFVRSLVKNAPSIVTSIVFMTYGPVPQTAEAMTSPSFLISTGMSILSLCFALMMLFTPRRQMLHDLLANTVVLKKYNNEQF
jgi:uncharacterized RDD family membrane protein YckC